MRRTPFCLFLVLLVVGGCNKCTENQTEGVSSKCQVHHYQMTKAHVPIRYGLIRFNTWGLALRAASTNNFPHAEDEILGGCIVAPNSPTRAVIYVCAKCVQAQEQWISEHPRPK